MLYQQLLSYLQSYHSTHILNIFSQNKSQRKGHLFIYNKEIHEKNIFNQRSLLHSMREHVECGL